MLKSGYTLRRQKENISIDLKTVDFEKIKL